MADFDFDATYTVEGCGIALRVIDYAQIQEWDYDELITNPDLERVVAIMVGDDQRHEFDIDELTKIDDDAYCVGCGQIGCSHG